MHDSYDWDNLNVICEGCGGRFSIFMSRSMPNNEMYCEACHKVKWRNDKIESIIDHKESNLKSIKV